MVFHFHISIEIVHPLKYHFVLTLVVEYKNSNYTDINYRY